MKTNSPNRSLSKGRRRFWAVLLLQTFTASPLLSAANEIKLSSGISETVSISFDAAPLKEVLVLLSQQSGFSFVASQEVEAKKVTVYLENVSAKDALDAIVTANGLTYTQRPGGIILVTAPIAAQVMPVGPESKVFRLKYARLSISPLQSAGQATIDDLTSIASASTSSSSSTSSSQTASSGSSAASSTSGVHGIDKIVEKLLSPKGKLAMDIRTNSLIVTDLPDQLEKIEKVIHQVDIPSRQVILEVYVMEVQKTLTSNLGVEWGGTDGALGTLTGGTRSTAIPFNQRALLGTHKLERGVTVPTLGTQTSTSVSIPDGMTLGVISAANFTATLRVIMSDAKTKILARPRVLTQNNEAAEIKVVTSQTVGLTPTTTSISGTVTGTATNVADRRDVGIQLKMTPQINADDSVVLFVEPSVSTASTSTFSTSFLDPRTRVVRTVARVKDNQTLVIGGLIEGSNSNTNKKIPILGDIPFIGKAFSYESKSDVDRELLVFITPHIAKGSDSFGPMSATAVGRDLAAKRMLDAFSEKEVVWAVNAMENIPVAEAKKKASDPMLDRLMTQALDAREKKSYRRSSLDQAMAKALDTQMKNPR